MIARPVHCAGTRLGIAGSVIRLPALRSAHRLSGASNWWNPAGISGGYYTNLAPDGGAIAQPDNPGGRAALYIETGAEEVTVSCTWNGVHAGGVGGPMACVVPSATEFGLSFVYEHDLFSGTWVLWELGRQPDDVAALATANEPGAHSDGVDIELSIQIRGTQVTCFAGGVSKIVSTVPVALRGSTLHGVAVDVNAVTDRPPNLPVLAAPLRFS